MIRCLLPLNHTHTHTHTHTQTNSLYHRQLDSTSGWAFVIVSVHSCTTIWHTDQRTHTRAHRHTRTPVQQRDKITILLKGKRHVWAGEWDRDSSEYVEADSITCVPADTAESSRTRQGDKRPCLLQVTHLVKRLLKLKFIMTMNDSRTSKTIHVSQIRTAFKILSRFRVCTVFTQGKEEKMKTNLYAYKKPCEVKQSGCCWKWNCLNQKWTWNLWWNSYRKPAAN